MVRWARHQGQSNKKRELEASTWQELKNKVEDKATASKSVASGGVEKRHLPPFMRDTRLWSSDLHAVVKDLRANGATEERIEEIVKKDLRRERRRLKRIKFKKDQQCCFQCRQPGHTLIDCPQTYENLDNGAGICFKCGSTEHKSIRCKAKVAPGEYPFASCFVCNQKGHLASKCPDNPRGLYPNGGGCKNCGSVEHFARDCPEKDRMRGIDNIALDTLSSSANSSADAVVDVPLATDPNLKEKKKKHKKKSKIVTF